VKVFSVKIEKFLNSKKEKLSKTLFIFGEKLGKGGVPEDEKRGGVWG